MGLALAGAFALTWLGLVGSGVFPLWRIFSVGSGASWLAALVQCVILGLGLYGLYGYALLFARVAVDRAIAGHVARECRRRLSTGEASTLTVEQLSSILPTNEDGSLASLRLFEAILTDAADHQFGTRELILEHYRKDSIDRTQPVDELQRVALHLGILGTFLGLVFAVPHLVDIGGENLDLGSFAPFFSGLESCFTTSVGGLITSLFLGGAGGVLEKRITRYFAELDEAVALTLALARRARNPEIDPQTLDTLNSSIRSLAERVFAQSKRIQIQTSAIEQGLQGLQGAREEFADMLSGVSSLKASVLEQVKAVHQSLNLKPAFQQLEDGMLESAKLFADEVAETTRSTEGVAKDIAEAVGDAIELSRETSESTQRALEALEARVSTLAEEREQYLEQLHRGLQNGARDRDEFADELRALLAEFSNDRKTTSRQLREFLEDLRSTDRIVASLEEGNADMIQALQRGVDHLATELRDVILVPKAAAPRWRPWPFRAKAGT